MNDWLVKLVLVGLVDNDSKKPCLRLYAVPLLLTNLHDVGRHATLVTTTASTARDDTYSEDRVGTAA